MAETGVRIPDVGTTDLAIEVLVTKQVSGGPLEGPLRQPVDQFSAQLGIGDLEDRLDDAEAAITDLEAGQSSETLALFGAGVGSGAAAEDATIAGIISATADMRDAAFFSSSMVRFDSDADGEWRPYLQRRDLPATTAVMESRQPIVGAIGYGQSLSVGGGSVDPPFVVTTVAPDPRRGLMFNTGTRGTGDTTSWDPDQAVDFAGALEVHDGVNRVRRRALR